MTIDFLNIVANAARRKYLRLSEGLRSPSASSYYLLCIHSMNFFVFIVLSLLFYLVSCYNTLFLFSDCRFMMKHPEKKRTDETGL